MQASRAWAYATLVCSVLIGLWFFWGVRMSQVEQPKYTVIAKAGTIEVRQYPAMIVAEVQVEGVRQRAIREGFKLLADFIFGNNHLQKQVAMTAPVQQQSTTIAMTAPVQQQASQAGWWVRFVMPSAYTMATLPQPNNKAVKVRVVPEAQYVVIRFSGLASHQRMADQRAKLAQYVEAHNLSVHGMPVYAFYNPPWTLPFFRRNEIMLALTKSNRGY